jgi:hypothetical protein
MPICLAPEKRLLHALPARCTGSKRHMGAQHGHGTQEKGCEDHGWHACLTYTSINHQAASLNMHMASILWATCIILLTREPHSSACQCLHLQDQDEGCQVQCQCYAKLMSSSLRPC